MRQSSAAKPRAKDRPAPSLAGRAYRRIKEMILTGEIPPLAPIEERGLMSQLALGRTPVREALQRLAHEGLVMIIPHRGTVASGIDMSDLDQIVELRVPLEILAGRLAAVRIRPEEAAELASLVDGWDVGKLCAERDFVELLRLDQDFHRAIARIARNRFLESTLEQLRDLTWRFYMVFYRRRAPAETDSFNNYRVIVTALAERDPERVEAALREHFRDSLAMFD